MIPLVIPPLTGLQVLVTRPTLQAEALCARIQHLGGTAVRLPVLTIEAKAATLSETSQDLLIFISSNAVNHGQSVLAAYPQARIAAVGAATALTLQALGYTVDVTPEQAANSEALLMHPLLQSPPARVLIVRGQGGRELLRETLTARGSQVEVIEVYERRAAIPEADQYLAVQTLLQTGELDVITATSVDTLHALTSILDDDARTLAVDRTLLAGSARIAAAARQLGWRGECVIANSPEDAALLTALTRWHTRARSELLR
ncbi:MAG: uroporphyrinogen-III synthase [Steroidobacteraceae bacterium]